MRSNSYPTMLGYRCFVFSIIFLVLFMIPTQIAFMEQQNPLVTIKFDKVEIKDALEILSKKTDVYISIDRQLKGKVSGDFKKVQLTQILTSILRQANGKFTVDGKFIYTSVRTAKTASSTQEMTTAGTSSIIQLNHLKAEDAKKIITALNPDVPIATEEGNNALIINADPDKTSQISQLISSLDKPARQVMFEAEIVEIQTGALKDLGLKYNWSKLPSAADSSMPGRIIFNPVKDYGVNWQADLKAYVENNKAKILAKPRIAVLNGQKARIFIGDNVPVNKKLTGTQDTYTDFKDVGIKLEVTAFVNSDDTVTTTLHPEVSTNLAPTNQIPNIRTREAETTMRLKNNEVVVIGGLIQKEERVHMEKIPLLGDIPLVGNAFKYKNVDKKDTELLIIIKPTIVK